MGDALAGGEVREPAEELDTIDAAAAPEPAPAPVEPPPEPPPPSVDHAELVTVERRHYHVVGVIAKGGMGRVLEARDLRLGRTVAIKELLPRSRDLARRFEREARITARLQHPAIIHVYEAGVWAEGDPFYAMQKVDGRSLDKVVAEKTTLAERLGLIPNIIAVADALAYAHSRKVIHRDLKPLNILVGTYGETVVIDWGLAKDLDAPSDPTESIAMRVIRAEDTGAGSVMGTPAYMSPEQAAGKSVDQRTDVYALGAVLYHVLVGAPPYTGRSDKVLELVKTEPCVPVTEREPGVPVDLAAIVAKAMARAPADRYADGGDLAADLKRFQTGQLVAARHYSRGQLVRRWLRRYRVPVLVATGALVAIAITAWVSVSRLVEEKAISDERLAQLVREKAINEERRAVLLEARGREELVARHAGRSGTYLVALDRFDGARALMIADAIRPFDAQVAELQSIATTRHVVAYSPDGKHVATATVEGVQIWSANGAREATCKHQELQTRIVAFDPSSTRIAVAGASGVVRVCGIDGRLIRELRGHDGTVIDAAWSPDGTRLVTGGADKTARVWLLEDGSMPTYIMHGGAVVSVRFAPRGALRVASAATDGSTSVWSADGDTGRRPPMRVGTRAVNTIRWNPEGTLVVTASGDGARILLPDSGRLAAKEVTHSHGAVHSAEFSHDGTQLVTAGDDRTARIWEVPEAPPPGAHVEPQPAVELVRLEASAAVRTAIFSGDDKMIATTDLEGVARVWDVDARESRAVFEDAETTDALFSPDGARLLTSSRNKSARIWEIARGHVYDTSLPILTKIHGVAAGRGVIAIAGDDGTVRIVRGGVASRLDIPELSRKYAVAVSSDGRYVASGGEGTVVIVTDLATAGHAPLAHPPGHVVRSIVFRRDGEALLTATDEGVVHEWTTATGARRRTLRHDAPITAIAISPDGAIVAGIASDGHLVVWHGADERAEDLGALTSSAAHAIAFSPDGASLAVGGATDTRLFAIVSGHVERQPRVSLDDQKAVVTAIAFTDDGCCLITGGHDGVRLWDAAKGKDLGKRGGGMVTGLAVAGARLWVATEVSPERSDVRAWKIDREQRAPAEVRRVADDRIPWRLDNLDVVRRTR